jgi:diaminohydroxyphosphoribosylaminopyrimidine deaminase / 5-amino-6-(5-phosphoribosylamino)uracil reductase
MVYYEVMQSQVTEVDLDKMRQAIVQARRCPSAEPAKPKVGAIIAVGDVVIGQGFRTEDHHAEKNAIGSVLDSAQLARATLYTTLEPCTPDVRSDPLTCCTALIQQHRFQRVFIGILDPNQGVRGKGLWELQTNGIDVELFPPQLAEEIRILNADFIRFQQGLGLRIINLESGQEIRT